MGCCNYSETLYVAWLGFLSDTIYWPMIFHWYIGDGRLGAVLGVSIDPADLMQGRDYKK